MNLYPIMGKEQIQGNTILRTFIIVNITYLIFCFRNQISSSLWDIFHSTEYKFFLFKTVIATLFVIQWLPGCHQTCPVSGPIITGVGINHAWKWRKHFSRIPIGCPLLNSDSGAETVHCISRTLFELWKGMFTNLKVEHPGVK